MHITRLGGVLAGVGLTFALILPGSVQASAADGSAAKHQTMAVTRALSCPDLANHEDAQRDGYNCSTVSAAAAMKWSDTFSGNVSYPVIAGGRVFVTTSDSPFAYGGLLYALNSTTGAILWGPKKVSGIYYSFYPAYDAGTVFVAFENGVSAYSAATGKKLWTTKGLSSVGEPVVANGNVWVEGAGAVYALSEKTGKIKLVSSSVDGDGANPAVNSSGVYISTGCDTQAKLSLSLASVWYDNDGCSGGGGDSTALWQGAMYGSDGNEVLSQATGVEEGSFSGIPAFDGTTGFFATGDQVAADDVSNLQQPLWTVTLSATVTAGPVATPAAIWVGTGAWQLLALDPSTGAILAEFPLPGQPGGVGDGSGNADNMGVGNQLVVVPTTNKMLTAFG